MSIAKQLKIQKKKTKDYIEGLIKECIKQGKFTTDFAANVGSDTDLYIECIDEISKSIRRTGYHLEIHEIKTTGQYSKIIVDVVKNK